MTIDDWCAVQVRANRERLSASLLRERGYDIFLPCYRLQCRWSDRLKQIDKALFPGYLFCRLHAGATGKVVTTPGVIRIVGNDRGPLPIPADEIAAIQRMVAAQIPLEPWSFLQVGQRIRIEHGPLKGTEGIVVTLKDRTRFVASISLLQRSVAVVLDMAWVSVAEGALTCHAAG